jgi:hypothetical protein
MLVADGRETLRGFTEGDRNLRLAGPDCRRYLFEP